MQSVGNPALSLPLPSLPPSCYNYANFVPPTEAWEARRSTTTREREREKRNRKMGKVEMKCFSHMNASECICPPKEGKGRGMTTRRQRGQSWAAIESFFYVWWKRVCCCSVAQFSAVAEVEVAENVGNSWKQFFVVKDFKSRSRSRAVEAGFETKRPEVFFFFLLLSHNEKQRAIYRVQTEGEGGRDIAASACTLYISLSLSVCPSLSLE